MKINLVQACAAPISNRSPRVCCRRSPAALTSLCLDRSRFCDTVYFVSAQSRCSYLAGEMVARFPLREGAFTPSPPPPQPPPPPPLPPPPPSPLVPADEDAREYRPDIYAVRLSTYFVPEALDARGGRELLTSYGSWPGFVRAKDLGLTESSALRDEIVEATTKETWTKWAGCSIKQITLESPGTPPLPCRTGASPATCVDGSRRCGTLEGNSRAPYAEFEVDAVRAHFYLFAIEFTLPDSPVYGPLLFKSYYEAGGTGYSVTLTDDHRFPLRTGCLPWTEQNVAFWTKGLRTVQHRCAKVLASDADLEELARARHVKITLNGANRQLWVDGIQLIFRERVGASGGANPSPPPQSPHVPPQPKAPPDAPIPGAVGNNCITFFGQFVVPGEATVLVREPCGETPETCCAHAFENGASGFQISGAGCCDLLTVTDVGRAFHESSINRGWVSGWISERVSN